MIATHNEAFGDREPPDDWEYSDEAWWDMKQEEECERDNLCRVCLYPMDIHDDGECPRGELMHAYRRKIQNIIDHANIGN